MTIDLIAYDVKEKLMQDFCIAYRGVLSKNILYTIGTMGRLIEEVASLSIHKYLAEHPGGTQQIIAQIEYNEMDSVIFLRDPQSLKLHEPGVSDVVRSCDIYNIPLAINLVSAELPIKASDRGGMEW